jgi:hypothetical protein
VDVTLVRSARGVEPVDEVAAPRALAARNKCDAVDFAFSGRSASKGTMMSRWAAPATMMTGTASRGSVAKTPAGRMSSVSTWSRVVTIRDQPLMPIFDAPLASATR